MFVFLSLSHRCAVPGLFVLMWAPKSSVSSKPEFPPLLRFTEADWLTAHCVTDPGFLRRESIVLYYSVVSDIVTDALSKLLGPLFALALTQAASHLNTNLPSSSNASQNPTKGQHRPSSLPEHLHDCHRYGARYCRSSVRNS